MKYTISRSMIQNAIVATRGADPDLNTASFQYEGCMQESTFLRRAMRYFDSLSLLYKKSDRKLDRISSKLYEISSYFLGALDILFSSLKNKRTGHYGSV